MRDGAGLRQVTSDASYQPLYTLLSPDGHRTRGDRHRPP